MKSKHIGKNPAMARTAKLLSLLLVVLSGIPAFALPAPLGLNDIFILLPLPKDESQLEKTAEGSTFIPLTMYDDLVRTFPSAERTYLNSLYPKWIAVSYRIDPRGIRVTWQPWFKNGVKGSTLDAAIETSYPVTSSEWPDLLTALRTIKKNAYQLAGISTSGRHLKVHPGFGKQGLASDFGKDFQPLILRWIDDSRMRELSISIPTNNENQRVLKTFQVHEIAFFRLNPISVSYQKRTASARKGKPACFRPFGYCGSIAQILPSAVAESVRAVEVINSEK